jgi:hypothetical protein
MYFGMLNFNLRSEHRENQAWYTTATSGVTHYHIHVHVLQNAPNLIVFCVSKGEVMARDKIIPLNKG